MKKAIILIVVMLVLSACTIKTASTDDSMSTRVAQILTQEYTEPAPTELPVEANTTSAAEEVETESTPQVVLIITATPTFQLPSATATLEPTGTNTEAPTEIPPDTPEPTQTAAGDPRQRLGTPVSTDPMDSEEMWNWPVGDQEFTSIAFKKGSMQLSGLKTVAGWRLPMVPAVTDMYVEMTVRTGDCKQDDSYGIIFHIPVFNQPDQGYLFTVSCDGSYRLTKWDGKAGTSGKGWRLVDWTPNEHINSGSGAVNRIGVMTKGDRFYLYSNGYLMNDDLTLEDTDHPYSEGHFGVFVAARQTENFTIFIDEMSYWDSAFKP